MMHISKKVGTVSRLYELVEELSSIFASQVDEGVAENLVAAKIRSRLFRNC